MYLSYSINRCFCQTLKLVIRRERHALVLRRFFDRHHFWSILCIGDWRLAVCNWRLAVRNSQLPTRNPCLFRLCQGALEQVNHADLGCPMAEIDCVDVVPLHL